MKLRIANTAIAAAALCAFNAAHAGTGSASIKLSNFSITAIDLVPGDAQLPSYELFAQNTPSNVRIYRGSNGSVIEKSASGLFSPVALSANDGPNATASASVTATGFEARVSGTGMVDLISARVAGSDPLLEPPILRVAPGTGLFFSGDYEIALSLPGECLAVDPTCQAKVSLQVSIWGPPKDFYDPDHHTSFWKQLFIDSGSRTLSGTAGAAYVNFTHQYQTLKLSFHSSVSLFTSPSTAVPEPAALGLAMAGVCTALIARRRSARRGAAVHQALA